MFSHLHRHEMRVIDAGRVSCPLRQGDAEVDECLRCPFSREVKPDGRTPFVRCRPPRPLLRVPVPY